MSFATDMLAKAQKAFEDALSGCNLQRCLPVHCRIFDLIGAFISRSIVSSRLEKYRLSRIFWLSIVLLANMGKLFRGFLFDFLSFGHIFLINKVHRKKDSVYMVHWLVKKIKKPK